MTRTDRPLRVLLSVRPYRGHLHPFIPLARAFARRGHAVAIATAEDVGEVVVRAGLSWYPAGLNPRQAWEIFPRSDPDYSFRAVQAKVDDLLAVSLGEFRPDVFVREPTDLAPIVASEVLGGLSVTYGLSRFIPMSSWEILGADVAMTRLRREYSLSNDPSLECMYAGLYLAVLPDSMEVHSPLPVPAVQRIRYVPWDGDATVESFGESERRGWPRVLMTLGTVYNQDRELFERLFAAVDGENIEVVCTLGDGADETVVESAPGNVRFVRYLPHSQILPTCDAMVCHGGFNTVLGALVAGVPLVVIPLGSDQDYNANLCARRGYGIALAGEEATSESIRMALRRVLSDRSFAAKVGVFQQTMAKRPPLGAAVRRIENLVAVGATR